MFFLRKYFSILGISFQSLSEYRFDVATTILVTIISNLVLFLFWHSLATSGVDIRPYTVTTLALYYLFIAVSGSVISFSSNDLATEIRSGDAHLNLLKPMSYLGYFFCATSASRILSIVLGMLVFSTLTTLGGLSWSLSPDYALAVVVALGLAIVGNFLVYYLVGVLAVWTQHIHGFSSLVSVLSSLVSGTLIPLDFLPSGLNNLAQILPFRYFIYFPAQIFINQMAWPEIGRNLLIELVWVIILYAGYKLLWHIALKNLEGVST